MNTFFKKTVTNAASREPVRYNPLDLKWRLCSHIVYTFAMPDPVTFLLRPSDPWADIENKFYEGIFVKKFVILCKILINFILIFAIDQT